MSRSNNVEIVSPCEKYFEWSGSEGKLKSYNKEASVNEWTDLPFTFLVLDILTCIAGYSDKDQSGYWSNEVKDISKEPLTVKTKLGTVASGLYKDIKLALASIGADYAQSVYIAYYNEKKELVIGNIKIKGSAIGQWIEFRKKTKIYDVAIVISKAIDEKKGATKYKIPVFESKEVSEATNKLAIELDKVLQDYLSKKLNRPIEEEKSDTYQPQPEPQIDHVPDPVDDNSLPF